MENETIQNHISSINTSLDDKINSSNYKILSDRVDKLVSIDHLHALEDRLSPMLNDAFDKMKNIIKDHKHINSAMRRYDEMIMDKA